MYSQLVSVEFVTQHAKRMLSTVSLACMVMPYVFTLSHKRLFFGKDYRTKICVLIFCTNLFATFSTLRRTERDIVKHSTRLNVEYPKFLSDFQGTWLSDRVSRNNQIPNFMKICPIGAKLLHADTQTGMTKLIAAFRNFRNLPKICMP
jgi:hypothetical protein